MQKIFAPGCALMIYKPHLATKVHALLKDYFGQMEMLQTCCKRDPQPKTNLEVINICPGCDKRFNNDYDHTTTISLWELMAQKEDFPFPDYSGKTMSIIDACPTRNKPQLHDAIRILLKKMNIHLVEPEKTRAEGTCCGDTFYGTIPTPRVMEQMKKRTSEMPSGEVVVYCISCTKSVFIGGKQPRYLVDLLFNEETIPQTIDPDIWHKELDVYIAAH
jgi:Fe-S oxidoreductase